MKVPVTTRMVLKPDTLDVMVASNLHADILSDLAAALSGSLGIGATSNLNPERTYPSLFEPIHGSAFDYREDHESPKRNGFSIVLSKIRNRFALIDWILLHIY